ncbi:MAG: CrcB family protein [Saprospiraceae bacterium]|nr:CrcB family protein [Saprospiraceae bacterium]MBK7788322.1 CrcB family protein [Saprospiraceae bacterium]MBK8111046.1 CrcB family protein [Saprospiraceae bacterium]MBK8851538.1 CrcB family protein [Saprospiraceae bacterium]MBK9688275.1 CrcB family protein [Saprospiraceae bacterium]
MGFVYVFMGGGIGAVCRYALGLWLGRSEANVIPWHTLLSNVLACLIAGMLIAWLPKSGYYSEGRLWLLTGFCGGFSTFSTFGVETIFMLQRGHSLAALSYMALSLASCLMAVVAGIKIMG